MSKHPLKTVAVFGGSGKTGQELLKLASAQSIATRALIRKTSNFESANKQLSLIKVSLQNPIDVERTLKGCDAVACVFGPRPPYTNIFCARATKIIIDEMQAQQIDRLICLTGAMIGDYNLNRNWSFQIMAKLFHDFSKENANDRAQQEQLVKASGLDWTLVKPPKLTNQQGNGLYTVGSQLTMNLRSSLARADLAAFMLTELITPLYNHKAVFIRNASK